MENSTSLISCQTTKNLMKLHFSESGIDTGVFLEELADADDTVSPSEPQQWRYTQGKITKTECVERRFGMCTAWSKRCEGPGKKDLGNTLGNTLVYGFCFIVLWDSGVVAHVTVTTTLRARHSRFAPAEAHGDLHGSIRAQHAKTVPYE